MKPWRTVARRTVFDRPPWVRVESHTVELPDGRLIEDWPWVETPEYVTVVAVTEEDLFLVFRQTKYAVGGVTLAPPGGYLEAGEEPLDAARRELLEEIGHESDDWTSLGRYVVDGNRGCGVGHLYLAQSVRPVARPAGDDLEEQELLRLSRAEVAQALRTGEFEVMGWTTAIALALLALSHDR